MSMLRYDRWRSGLTLAILAGLPHVAGCSDDKVVEVSSAAHTGVLANLMVDAREEADVDRTPVIVAQFTMRESNRAESPWIAEGPEPPVNTLLLPAGGTDDRSEMIPGVALRLKGPKSFTHPVEFDAGGVTSVLAFVASYGEGTERVRAVAFDPSGKAMEASEWQTISCRRDPYSLAFNLVESKEGGRSRSGVRLEFEGEAPHAALMSMALLNADVAARMPKVGEPEIVKRGTSWRSAAGLTEGAPWTHGLERGKAGTVEARVRLSLSSPVWSRGNSSSAKLYVSVHCDGAEISARALDIARLSAEEWKDVDVELGVLPAGACTIRIWAEDDDPDRLAHALIGDAVMVEPNDNARVVLLITSDTHRADYLGLAGARRFVDTPSLDALGRRGAYFDSAFSTTNVTNPSHIAIMTGIHPRDTRIVDNETQLTEAAHTLAEIFRSKGYRTFGAISTQHLDPGQCGLGQGFGRFDSPPDFKRSGNIAVDIVGDWIDGAQGESVFAWVHLFDAHAPYDPPASSRDKYTKGVDKSVPGGLSMAEPYQPSWVRRAGIENTDYVNALYAAEVDFVDRSLGRLFDHARMQDAIIAFTADHGESFTTHSIYWDHAGMYLPMLAVPLILTAPAIEPVVSSVPVHQSNIGRTLLDLADIDVDFPGTNLIESAVESRRIEPLYGLASHGLQASITLENWHLVLDLRDFSNDSIERDWAKGKTELFDRKDGLETETDRSTESPEVAAELRAALIDWLASSSSEGLGAEAQLTESAKVNLEVLGYTGFTKQTSSTWYTVDPSKAPR